MAFTDLDPAELALGKSVTMMTDSELVTYLKIAVHHQRDIDLAVDGTPERAIMAGLKRTYGVRAGNIVKWACYHHGAMHRGTPINHYSFTKGRKWYTDQLDAEVQQHLRELASATTQTMTSEQLAHRGFATGL